MSINTILVFLTSIASLLLAALVYFSGGKKSASRTLALFSLNISVWLFAQAMGAVFLDKGIVLLWTRINVGAAVLLPVLYLHFIFELLGRSGKQKITLALAYAFAMVFIALVFTPLFVKDVIATSGYRFYPQAGVVYPFFAVYLFSVFVYGLILLFAALLRSKGEQYRRLLYVFIASLIGLAGGATTFCPIFGIDFPVVSHFALPIYVAITAYAIIKHKLLDINFVIRESLIYSALTVSFAAFYTMIILFTERMFSKLPVINESLVMIFVVAVSVAVFQPLRDWIQKLVDRVFFRGSYYYEKTINDLSDENKKLFNSLLRSDKLAALGTMAAGMAHEIKNPLAAIKGMTQILPDNLGDSKFISEYSEMIPRQLDRINKIVENLLKAGKAPKLEKQKVNVNNILSEALDFYSNISEKQNVIVEKQMGNVPDIMADPDQLHQVFANLILNAIQAMPGGGKLIIKTAASADKVTIQISDTGVGIPDEKMSHIFDPFFSLKEAGTGLGLFIAYRIISEHGGGIDVTSGTGQGAAFKIWLYTKQKG